MPSSRSVLHNRATKANGFNPCPINRVPRVESVCKDSVDLDVKPGQFSQNFTRIAEGKRETEGDVGRQTLIFVLILVHEDVLRMSVIYICTRLHGCAFLHRYCSEMKVPQTINTPPCFLCFPCSTPADCYVRFNFALRAIT